MTDYLSVFRRINTEHTPAFRSPMTWHSNGARGHLHASAYCHKIDNKRSPVTHALALYEALERKVCGECLSHGSWNTDQRAVLDAAIVLTSTERRLSNPDGEIRREVPTQALKDVCIRAFTDLLRSDVTARGHAPGLESWTARVLEAIDVRAPAAPDPEIVQAEGLRIAIPAVITQRLRREALPESFWGESLQGPVTPYSVSRGNSELGRFLRLWLGLLTEGIAVEDAGEQIVSNFELFAKVAGEPSQELMMRCTPDEPPISGESVWEYVMRLWRKACEKACRSANSGMQAYYATLAEPAPYVLVANRRNRDHMARSVLHGDLQQLLAITQAGFSHGERSVIHCHPTVAAFLTGDRDNYSVGDWSQPIVAPEMPCADVLETALALWDPYARTGEYSEFAAALEAAKVL
jgi:hypothetical protein